MLKKLYMKEQRETFWRILYTGCSLNRKFSHDMHSKKQCLFSCDMWKNTSGFWTENSSFDDWFSVYLFHGKIIAFVIFTLLIYRGPITEVVIILMPQLRQDTVFTLLASHLQLLRKILLTDAQNHCVYNGAEFKISALLLQYLTFTSKAPNSVARQLPSKPVSLKSFLPTWL